MTNQVFTDAANWIGAGMAPGCAIVLAGKDKRESFVCGTFSGPGSQAVSIDTVYDVASITKLFTAALILRLHEQGKLSIYDRCERYLDNFHSSELKIVDLLTHRANFGIRLSEYRLRFPDSDSLYNALMQFKPPARAAPDITYANLEFFYLGIIVERITGNSLHDELKALFDMLGLHDTCTGPDVAQLHLSVPPTEIVDGQVIQGVTHDETARMLGGLTGHAGIFSTANDLATFGQAWLNGKVVSEQIFKELVCKDYDPSGKLPQALGWWMRVTTPDGVISTPGVLSHTGFTGPFLAICPATDKVGAFVCNRTYYGRDNTEQRHIWEELVTWVC